MENGKEKLRCRGQNKNVDYIAVGKTQGENRTDRQYMKRKKMEFPENGENLLQENHSEECAGNLPGNPRSNWLGHCEQRAPNAPISKP